MKYPTKTKYAWIQIVKDAPYSILVSIIISTYVFINLLMANVYFLFDALKDCHYFLNYYYFSFITALTIGFGDYTPQNDYSKIIVIIHGCFTLFYFSLVISVLSLRLIYPKNTIAFSKCVIFDPLTKYFCFRVLNTHRSPLINPEIRIHFVEHCFGNVIATNYQVYKYDDLPYLGKHDFSFHFNDELKIKHENKSIISEWNQAINHDRNNSDPEKLSRFRIVISITGSYGMQNISQLHKYYPIDIVEGKEFKNIQYNKHDKKLIGNISYKKFPNFWSDFNSIIA